MSTILGISAFYHDSAAAIIKNGEVLCAVEEERFNRIKHWSGFPSQSIKYCLQNENIDFTFTKYNAGICLMHSQGLPENMQEKPHYNNVLLDIYDYLEEKIAEAESTGISRKRIIIDIILYL